MDQYGNYLGSEYDLGKDGAFSDFSVLIGQFHRDLQSGWGRTAGAALAKKGFRVKLINPGQEKEFITALAGDEYDVAWIISEAQSYMSYMKGMEDEFTKAVTNYHNKSRGLMIWGDNDPYYYHANLVLPNIAKCKLFGNDYCAQTLTFGDANTKGHFDKEHICFAGVNNLYEGITICSPDKIGKLKVLATSTYGKTCIASMEITTSTGRVIVDTGFTKLYPDFWSTAGQARYVVNACVWLVDVERRFGGSEKDLRS